MRDLDFCMLTTHTKGRGLRARPMSNNREVEFDGDVWFFSAADSRKVREIEATPRVHLSYVDLDQWRFLSLTGRARIVRDAQKKRQLDLRDLSLSDFELVPFGDDGAVLTYRAGFETGRGLTTAVIASSVWHRGADGWKTMFFQATEIRRAEGE